MIFEGFPVERGDGEGAALGIMGIFALVIGFFGGPFQRMKDELADRHAGIHPYRLEDGDF
jgi:hypothetical protein